MNVGFKNVGSVKTEPDSPNKDKCTPKNLASAGDAKTNQKPRGKLSVTLSNLLSLARRTPSVDLDIRGLYIKGDCKFRQEFEYAEKRGTDGVEMVLDHIIDQSGVGEPDESQEIIEQDYNPRNNFL